jgi:hypothetical protein
VRFFTLAHASRADTLSAYAQAMSPRARRHALC